VNHTCGLRKGGKVRRGQGGARRGQHRHGEDGARRSEADTGRCCDGGEGCLVRWHRGGLGVMVAILFFKCHSLELQVQSDIAREVFPHKGVLSVYMKL
jgi:hypothetical protein